MAGESWSFETRAVHAGRNSGPVPDPNEPRPEGLGTPVAPSIQPSSSYYFDQLSALDEAFQDPRKGYVYARHGGPTPTAFADAVAALEGTDGALAFSSGMAAIHAALVASEVGRGDTVLASRDLYGATQTLLTTFFASQGVRVQLVDATQVGAIEAAAKEARPKVIYVETISNPLLRLPDLAALGALAKDLGSTFIVDNTFASPYLCRPQEFGAQMVVHSATKYLGGHGDLTAGVVAAEARWLPALQLVSRLVGGTLGAFDAWLAMRGVRTLALRMERHCENAATVAAHLVGHPRVSRVHYPGLTNHPQHTLAARQLVGRGYGGMVSFELKDAGPQQAGRFMDQLRLILPAPTMGDVYSLALYPAQASHRGLSPEQRAELGIGDNLLRLSIGIEAITDVLDDLDQALAATA